VEAAQFGQHLAARVHRAQRVVAAQRPFTRRIADLVIQRGHGRFVHHPWCVRELERVPQLVAEHRDADVAGRTELQGHAHVAVAARRRQELGGRRGGAEQRTPAQVDDQVGRGEALQDGAERRRVVAAAHDGIGQLHVVGAQEGRRQGLGGGVRAACEQGHGGEPPARTR